MATETVSPAPRSAVSTITFPYKRSLGPVLGCVHDRAHRASGSSGSAAATACSCPPLGVGPDTGRGARATTSSTSGPPARSSRGAGSRRRRAAPARPPVRVRAGQLDGADTALVHAVDAGVDRRDGDRHAGRAAVAGRAQRPHHRHRGLRPRRGAGASVAATPGPAEPVDDDGLQRVDHVHDAGHRQRRCVPSRPTTRAGSSGCSARRAAAPTPAGKGYCPVDSIELTPRARGRPPAARRRSPTTRSSRRCSTRARPRPSRSPGCTSARRHRRGPRLPGAARHPERRRAHRHARRRGVGLGRREGATAAADRRGQGLVGWMPTGEPDVDDPDLVNRIC